MCRQTTVRYNSYNIETVGKEEKYTFIKRWWNKIANNLIFSYLEVEMTGLCRVGLVGVVVVLVGAVLVVIHLALSLCPRFSLMYRSSHVFMHL